MKDIILVTGGTGFVGSHLIERLIKENYEIRTTIRKTSNTKWLNKLDVRQYPVDWHDPANIEKMVAHADYIIHCAGVTKGLSQQDYYNGNVVPTRALLKAAEKQKQLKRFIFISSQAVAGPAPTIEPINETQDCRPLTDYGYTKLEAEKEVLNYRLKFPVSILRPCPIYGPRDHEIYTMFKLIKLHLAVIIGDGRKKANMVHVRDFVDSILLTVQVQHPTGSVYFVTDGEIYDWNSIYQIAKEVYKKKTLSIKVPIIIPKVLGCINDQISRISKKPALLNSQKIKELLPNFWLCSSEKIIKELNYAPRYNLRQGFLDTLTWYQQENWL